MVKRFHGILGVAAAVVLVAFVSGCTTTQSPKRQIDDNAITAAVKAKLTAARFSNIVNVDVNTTNGIVTLAGEVRSSTPAPAIAAGRPRPTRSARSRESSCGPLARFSAPMPPSAAPVGPTPESTRWRRSRTPRRGATCLPEKSCGASTTRFRTTSTFFRSSPRPPRFTRVTTP